MTWVIQALYYLFLVCLVETVLCVVVPLRDRRRWIRSHNWKREDK